MMQTTFGNQQYATWTPLPFSQRERPAAAGLPMSLNGIGTDTYQPRFGRQYGSEKKIWSYDNGGKLRPAVTDWDDITPHDVERYLMHNYGAEQPFPEDREIIETLLKALKEDGLLDYAKKAFAKEITEGKELLLADVGAGGNFYPSLMLTGVAKALNAEHYSLELIEYTRASREVIYRSLYGTSLKDMPFQEPLWNKYRDLLREKGGSLWDTRFDTVREHARIVEGDIYKLPKERYHAAVSFFTLCSIRDSREEFEKAVRALVDSVKPGGIVAGGLMMGSTGWSMGTAWLPAFPVTKEIVENAFKKAGVYIHVSQIDAPPGLRDGYDGMLVYSGIKKLN
jgi:hypothetical protein